ncbi:MAG: alpha/beta hydrolase [Gammaproteobacteria bacterium]|nr:alpha/beta hydrolase [Gammaproteobacteria bacterium]
MNVRSTVRTLIITAAVTLTASAMPAQADVIRNVVYGQKDGLAMVMDVYKPDSGANGAAVAYMISGGWMSSLPMQSAYESMFVPLVDAGYTVFTVRHGSSPRYNVLEAWSDVSRAFQFIGDNAASYGVDTARIGVSGISAGGHLSLMLGLSTDGQPHRPAAVVAYMPPTDLRGMTGPNDNFPALNFADDLAPGVSPVDFASAGDPPVLLVHGDADELVNIRHSENMFEVLQAADITSEFIVIPGAPHGLFTGDDAVTAADALRRWFDQHL